MAVYYIEWQRDTFRLRIAHEPTMKTRTQLLLGFLMPILVSGCMAPLNVQSNGERVAEILDVEQSDIRFMSYCYYAEVQDLEKKSVYFTYGIVVLTPNHLCLLDAFLKDESADKWIVVPVAEIDGVGVAKGGFSRQVQLLQNEHVIAISFLGSIFAVKDKESQGLRDLLISAGVPQFRCERYFKDRYLTLLIPPPIPP